VGEEYAPYFFNPPLPVFFNDLKNKQNDPQNSKK